MRNLEALTRNLATNLAIMLHGTGLMMPEKLFYERI
jgi:hypothetical protein